MKVQELIDGLTKAGHLTEGAGGDFTNRRGRKLREANNKKLEDILYLRHKNPKVNDETRSLREGLKRRFGIDMFNESQFPVNSDSFDWMKLRDKLNLREADSASSFTQFLRAGIQTIATYQYKMVETTYDDWVKVIPSGMDTELYTPNHGVSFPREVERQGKYPEVGAAALDIKLRNKKYGSMYVVEQELLEDDQTGSFQRNSAYLGEYLRLVTEAGCYGKLASVAPGGCTYLDLHISPSETKPSYEANYPWATPAAPLVGGGATRPTAFGTFNQANVQAGIIALMNQLNLLGIKMQVDPSRLLVGTQLKFDAYLLLNSAWYPSGTNAAGVVGGPFSVNPLKSIAELTVTRFMPTNTGLYDGTSRAWYLVDDNHFWFTAQMREPIAVVQENPQSGQSFESDVFRFKGRTRQNWDIIDPRFAWQGSDGSV